MAGSVSAAVFEPYGMGARAIAMGESFVAVANDYSAVYWNPAGLGRLDKKTLHSEYRNLYGLGLLRTMTIGYIQPQLGLGTMGFSWFRLETMGDAGYLDYSENSFIFSYGSDHFAPFLFGLNGKYYRVHSAMGASGMGLDAGLMYVLKDPLLIFGIAVQDLNHTMISWDSGTKDRLPIRIRAGVSSQLPTHTLLTAQISLKDQKNETHHLGLEQNLFNQYCALRLGVLQREKNVQFSWGLGLKVRSFDLDYGWQAERYLGDTQVFSLSVKF
ncbi:MAG: hypothetical protein HYY63_04075 [Elusimicrobia bacterium]|nr:hypothetical protein [Elusimicrobiota bacterium]